ncbi:MAG: ABC transporter ATP-binding protein [Bryobacteraceae bacterium]
MNPVLQLRGVTKRFPSHAAVDDVSLDIERGSLFALVGPSGCGKTTTLRMIAGFETPTSGQILLNGQDIAPLAPYERNVSTVFQSYALFPHMTARENIRFGLEQQGAADIDKRVDEVLDLVRMKGKESRKPANLSGGEKQRIALARSLVVRPDVLLLDEPLSALDPTLRREVRQELKELQQRVGITFVIVTHHQEEALAMADQIAILNRGKLEQVGSPTDIYLRPASKFVAGFLGAVNWINGIGVRPEALRLSADAPSNGARSMPARVMRSVFLGNCLHVESTLADGTEVVAEVSRLNGSYASGENVHVWWKPGDEMSLGQ